MNNLKISRLWGSGTLHRVHRVASPRSSSGPEQTNEQTKHFSLSAMAFSSMRVTLERFQSVGIYNPTTRCQIINTEYLSKVWTAHTFDRSRGFSNNVIIA